MLEVENITAVGVVAAGRWRHMKINSLR